MPQNIKPIIGIVVAVIILGVLVFATKSSQEAKRLKEQLATLQQTQQQSSPDEARKLVEEVSKLIVLPEGEEPTVATITDKEKLKDVPFFTKAENGDKVLIYVNARKAFLYRAGEKRIIEVATLNLNTTANQDLAGKVVLRNGTDVAGLTRQFEDLLKQGLPKVEVVGRDNAKQTTFADTLVIDLAGTKKDEAQRLATALGAKVATLPTGETKPTDADFLIIIGRDKAAAAATTLPTNSPTPLP